MEEEAEMAKRGFDRGKDSGRNILLIKVSGEWDATTSKRISFAASTKNLTEHAS